MVAVPASLMGIVRVVRASSIAMTGVRVVMMVTARAARESLTVIDRARIAVRGSLIAMTAVDRANLTVMIDVRVVMMATDRVVRESSTVIDRAVSAVRASLIAMTAVARADLTVTTAVVRASSTATTGVHGVLIAAIATSRSVRRRRRIVDAQRCSSAKVAVSTAKTIRVRLAVMTSVVSSTRAQCADRESVMFAATSGAQPTSALAINVPPIAVTAMIGERGDINFLHLVHSKSNWPKRSVAPWETDGLPM